MGSLGTLLRYPDDIYPLLKMKRAIEEAEKQIPPEPHWGFCYSMLHKVSRSFSLVIQQLGTDLRNAVRSLSASQKQKTIYSVNVELYNLSVLCRID